MKELVMRVPIVLLVIACSALAAHAQPAGAGSDAGSGSDTVALSPEHVQCVAALNAATEAKKGTFVADVETAANGRLAADALAGDQGGPACLAAIAAEKPFRDSLAATARKDASDQLLANTEQEHKDAAAHIAKDQKHVILAYAAMWVIAAGFVIFLWRRQQGLIIEIAMLRRDLDAAAKDTK